MKISPKQIAAIIKLPVDTKYSHFVKRIVAMGSVWCPMFKNGFFVFEFLSLEDSDGQYERYIPVWPDLEYAELWSEEYKNQIDKPLQFVQIDVEEFAETILYQAEQEKIQIAALPVPLKNLVLKDDFEKKLCFEKSFSECKLSAEKLKIDIFMELEKY